MATVAVVVASGFEQGEMAVLCRTLAEAGHVTRVVSPKKHAVRAWDNTRWNGDVPVDVAAVDARADDYDALVLPGGLISADTLRADGHVVRLLTAAAAAGKPVAASGHAAWVLVEAGLLNGREATSHPAIRTDVVNAGASWLDRPVAAAGTILTGRHRDDAAELAAAVARLLG
ncbi:MAG: DJ-1/PfpI family protein [Pseudomonadota bacterium]